MSYWSVTHGPAANTKATIAKAAVTNLTHVVTGFTATLVTGASAPTAITVTFSVYDGTSAGTAKITMGMSAPATAGVANTIVVTGINIPMTKGNAATIEFSAAGGANTVEAVSLQGYSVVS